MVCSIHSIDDIPHMCCCDVHLLSGLQKVVLQRTLLFHPAAAYYHHGVLGTYARVRFERIYVGKVIWLLLLLLLAGF